MPRRIWVTCYSDASFSPDKGGAWAVWLRSELGRRVKAGLCPSYVKDSAAAELAAIFAGLFLAVSTWGERVAGVHVRCDAQSALVLLAPGAKPARKAAHRRLQEKVRALVDEHEIELDLRWVRGHQPRKKSTQAFLNHACDELAALSRKAAPGPGRKPKSRAKKAAEPA